MSLAAVTLDDKYTATNGLVYMTGTQALVRLPMMQHQRDTAANLKTGCYISGYRGSPLGNYDRTLWQARQFLEKQDIHFNPGVNEDLAATAIWGTQQVGLAGDSDYDGVFSIWYGKGPGVDRSIDVFKHANNAGTSAHGGVLAIAGDDHVCASSTLPHQSEYDFAAAQMPVLNPAGVQEFLDYGLYAWALSRYSGLWCGMVCIAETLDSAAIVSVDPHRVKIIEPTDYALPDGGLNIRWPDPPLVQEARLHEQKHDAAIAFARANGLDRVVIDGPKRRVGIVTTGKAYLDVRQVFDDLGIDDDAAAAMGLSLYKVGMVWPLEPEGIRRFAAGLDEVLVVEEKRGLIEQQMRDILYDMDPDKRPRVHGKHDVDGSWLLRAAGEIDPPAVVDAMARRFGDLDGFEPVVALAAEHRAHAERAAADKGAGIERIPYFCSGCPHNTSTKVPDGSRALAGIGCHYMVQWMDRNTETYTHMGGEGANWIGQSAFVNTPHVFQNLGDGTYFHSGILAIRAAVAANVNITYKILYNDAVAMTGGQPMDGPMSVERMTRQLSAEGVGRIAVVTDEPHKYPLNKSFAGGVTIHHRDDLDAVQRDIRTWEGVSAIVYDQVCATEKRRRRKRGLMEDPGWRVIINPDVCEGCGDCGATSNCLSISPLATEFGRKRTIDQSSCNMDYSCINGFCPSFVLVKGGQIRKREATGAADMLSAALPEPERPAGSAPYGILITGVGGMGIVTLAALLGMAARLEGKGATVLDKAGLAQKYGAVTSHVRIANKPEDLHAVRIATGGADLLLGADLVVAASAEVTARLKPGKSRAIVNAQQSMTGNFTRSPDLAFPTEQVHAAITDAAGLEAVEFIEATRMATALIGDAIATNIFLLGFAYQRGLIPLSSAAIEQAIALNGVAVDSNSRAFRWGRAAAHDAEAVSEAVGSAAIEAPQKMSETLDELVERRVTDLTAYQNEAYGARYRELIDKTRRAEARIAPGSERLTDATARGWHKLLAYKDEYEVARLYTDGRFQKQVQNQFDGKFSLHFHMAPPLLADRDATSGHLKKKLFGPWMMPVFRVLKHFKGLRGTRFDPFGWSAERRMERDLITEYESALDEIIADLSSSNYDIAVELAQLPLAMRGFGHVKAANVERARQTGIELLAAFRNPPSQANAAE